MLKTELMFKFRHIEQIVELLSRKVCLHTLRELQLMFKITRIHIMRKLCFIKFKITQIAQS